MSTGGRGEARPGYDAMIAAAGVITVLVAARRAARRARLEALVAGSRAVRLIAAPPGMALGEQVRTLRPDVVLVDLDGERIDTALHGLRSARAGVIALDDDPRAGARR